MTNANTPRAMIGSIPVFCAYDEIIPTAKALPNPQNPNQHPDKQINLLAEIIKQQGWRAPITISTRSGYIVRGHGRLMAARLLGAESVPVDFQNYESEAAEKADMIADNRIADSSLQAFKSEARPKADHCQRRRKIRQISQGFVNSDRK